MHASNAYIMQRMRNIHVTQRAHHTKKFSIKNSIDKKNLTRERKKIDKNMKKKKFFIKKRKKQKNFHANEKKSKKKKFFTKKKKFHQK